MNFKWTTLPARLNIRAYGYHEKNEQFSISGRAGEFRIGGQWSGLDVTFEPEQQNGGYRRKCNPAWQSWCKAHVNSKLEDEVVVLLDEDPTPEVLAHFSNTLQNFARVRHNDLYSFWPVNDWMLLSSESLYQVPDIELFINGEKIDRDCGKCVNRLEVALSMCKPFFPEDRARTTCSGLKCLFPLQVNGKTLDPETLEMPIAALGGERIQLQKCSMPEPFRPHTFDSISLVNSSEREKEYKERRKELSARSQLAAATVRSRNMQCAACIFHQTSGCISYRGCETGPYYKEEFELWAKDTPASAAHTVMMAGTMLDPSDMNELCSLEGTCNKRPRTMWRVGMPAVNNRVVVYADTWYARSRWWMHVNYDNLCGVLGVDKCEDDNDLRRAVKRHGDDQYVAECKLAAMQSLHGFFSRWRTSGWGGGNRWRVLGVDVNTYGSTSKYIVAGRGIELKYEHGCTTNTGLLCSDYYECQRFGKTMAERTLTDDAKLYRRESSLLNKFTANPDYPYIPGKLFHGMFAENMLDWISRTPTPKEVRSALNKQRRLARADKEQEGLPKT